MWQFFNERERDFLNVMMYRSIINGSYQYYCFVRLYKPRNKHAGASLAVNQSSKKVFLFLMFSNFSILKKCLSIQGFYFFFQTVFHFLKLTTPLIIFSIMTHLFSSVCKLQSNKIHYFYA